MSTSLRAGLGALFASVLTAASLALAGPAIATTTPVAPSGVTAISFVATGNQISADSIQVGAVLPSACDSAVAAGEITITQYSAPVPQVTVTAGLAPDYFVMVVPSSIANAPGGINSINASVTCNVSSTPVTMTGIFGWAQINITKLVEGPAPAGAAFPVAVQCTPVISGASIGTSSVEPATAPLTFAFSIANRETKSLLAVTNANCTIAEADSMGATTSLVSPATVTISASTTYNVTITNTFPEATPKFTG